MTSDDATTSQMRLTRGAVGNGVEGINKVLVNVTLRWYHDVVCSLKSSDFSYSSSDSDDSSLSSTLSPLASSSTPPP